MTFTMLRGVKPIQHRIEGRVLQERVTGLAGTKCALSDRSRRRLAQAAAHIGTLSERVVGQPVARPDNRDN